VTTPAQDAPLVFPAVAFRPIRLLVISLALTAAATVLAALGGRVMLGVFFGIGLLLGLLNAALVRRSVETITAVEHPLKKAIALNSASRLAIITIVGLVIAYVFRPAGLGVVFGLALFQVMLVASTALPVMKTLRAGTYEPAAGADSGVPNASEGRGGTDD
jgi:hypothetical protein